MNRLLVAALGFLAVVSHPANAQSDPILSKLNDEYLSLCDQNGTIFSEMSGSGGSITDMFSLLGAAYGIAVRDEKCFIETKRNDFIDIAMGFRISSIENVSCRQNDDLERCEITFRQSCTNAGDPHPLIDLTCSLGSANSATATTSITGRGTDEIELSDTMFRFPQ